MSGRGFFNPTWRGFTRFGATAALAPFVLGAKGVGKVVGAYGKAVKNVDWSKSMPRALGMAAIGAPVAAAGHAVISMDKPVAPIANDYGKFLAQNTMNGNIPTQSLGNYDMKRSLESSQNAGLVKLNSAEPSMQELEKMAMSLGFARGMAENIGSHAGRFFGKAKDIMAKAPGYLHGRTLGPEGALTPMNVGMSALGVGYMVHSDAKEGIKTMGENMMKQTNLRNDTPIL